MNSKYYIKLLNIFIISLALNFLSILASPFVSPDDLGQVAFIMFIFFPIAAVITGILSQRQKTGIWVAPLISALTVAIVIIVTYNSSGLKFALIYAAISLAGYLVSWGLEVFIKKMKK